MSDDNNESMPVVIEENYSDVIDLWREDYETSENKTKFKIMKITKKNELKNQHVSSIKGSVKTGKKIEVFLLYFDTSDDEITYGCISGSISITSENKEMVEKIRGHPEELALFKLRETNPNYEYQKTVNDFVSDSEVYEAIIEN
ncbi:2256_t:CDS:2 [Scutellospora calospora]|uniref:2256_t:CDS:1 n=1 Tax=Scutellospora calospora TaxID=85575 RepID=A0ACA9N954_9GLOM|nr:2256_t:CDS:2 [Scutellospora calospora]